MYKLMDKKIYTILRSKPMFALHQQNIEKVSFQTPEDKIPSSIAAITQ